MASPLDLTSLASVKAWLGIDAGQTNSDAILTPLITAASRMIYAYLSRPSLLPRAWTEVRDGRDEASIMLRNWPVLSVTSLSIGGVAVAASPALSAGQSWQSGYILAPADVMPPGGMQALSLRGNRFCRGTGNVLITYQAGYAIQAEPWTVPATPFQVTPLAPYGVWASDLGVTYALTGAALSLVTGTPSVGQYTLAVVDGVQAYQFAAADVGAGVLISYGFVPSDLAEACLELVGERFRYKDRIGQVSKSLGGQETVSYSQRSMPDSLALMLAPYRAVVAP